MCKSILYIEIHKCTWKFTNDIKYLPFFIFGESEKRFSGTAFYNTAMSVLRAMTSCTKGHIHSNVGMPSLHAVTFVIKSHMNIDAPLKRLHRITIDS